MEVASKVVREHLHSGDVQDCDGSDCTKRAVYKLSRPVADGKATHEFYCKSCAEDQE